MIQIYGRRKCAATRKAQRFFSDRRIPVQQVDLDQKAPGKRELELFVQIVGAADLIDSESALFRQRGMEFMVYNPVEELAENPELLVTPIVRNGRQIVVGDDETGWKKLAADAAGEAKGNPAR